MGYHLSVIPKMTIDHHPRFYVAHKTPNGDYAAISDDNPQDDVRSWGMLSLARGAAREYAKGGCRVDAIVRVDNQGWEILPVSEENTGPDHPDAGSW